MRTGNTFEKTIRLNENLIIDLKREQLLEGRILDEELSRRFNFIPLQNSIFSELGSSNEDLFLPKLYAALTDLTGPSDLWFDADTGSYSFTFLLTVRKNGHVFSLYLPFVP
jgi:hypothetical protein